MKTNNLLLTLLLTLFTVTANAAITPTKTMTIDASQMNATDYPVNSLQTVLENLTLTGTWEEAQVKILSDALSGASITGNNNLLKTADLSNAVMNSMKSLFKGCKALTDVTLPTAINRAPVSFYYAFCNCEKLKSVSGINRFTCITDFTCAFCECLELTSITLPEGSTSMDAISFEWAFANTPKVIEILNFEKFTNIKELRYAFFMHANYVSSLTSVKMPESNSYIGGIDMESAFNGCDKLTGDLNLSAFTNISKAFVTFRNCSSLESITLGGVPTILTYQGYENTFLNCSTDCKVYLPESVTEVPEGWKDAPVKFVLYNERPTPKVTYTEGGEEKTMDFSTDIPYAGLLANATAITATGEWTDAQVDELKNALRKEGNINKSNAILTTIDLSAMVLTEATDKFDFKNCTVLTEVKMPASDLRIGLIGTFSACTSLKTADVSGLTNVWTYGGTFIQCKKLESVKLPSAVSNAEPINFTSSFQNCEALTTVNLEAFTNVMTYSGTFQNCINMTEIRLGSTIPTDTEYGYNGTFNGCTKDCKVYLPEGVTEVPEGWQDAEVTFMINGQPVVISINTTGNGKAIPAVTYIYSIDGRLVRTVPAEEYSERLNGLDRGVYIVNGEKEAVVE